MKTITTIILLLSIAGCTDDSESGATTVFSTVDSNTIGVADTVPPILYLDNPSLDTFPMAMDSTGPTIEPQDTQYRKPAAYTVIE